MLVLRQAVLLCLLQALAWLPAPARSQWLLSLVEKSVDRELPVPSLSWQELRAALAGADSAQYMLIDVRTRVEYTTSHMRAALQVDPGLAAQMFLAKHGGKLAGRHLVFYCSVGYRSARLLQRVREQVLAAGAHSAVNLRGGIFRWYNEGNPVVNEHGACEQVHPYDSQWGVLLKKHRRTANSAAP